MQTNAYVTVATKDLAAASRVANIINVKYIQTNISTDSFGIAFGAVLKNSVSIAKGIANGLKHGENFRDVFTSNTMRRQPQCP
ncbi:hypothetical protein BH11BAC5_BH11BAC5_51910 [soil metagenome]